MSNDNVKRCSPQDCFWCTMEDDPDGIYIEADDYDILEKERDALAAENQELKHDIGRYIQQCSSLAEEVERLGIALSEAKTNQYRLMRLGMANGRNLSRPKTTSNAGLFSYLFGTGFSTATKKCMELGLDPDGTKSCLKDSRMPEEQTR